VHRAVQTGRRDGPDLQAGAKGLAGLRGTPKPPPSDMHITYLPGGIGAVAWHSLVSRRRTEPNTLVAFSGGSLLNLAQGKFGKVKRRMCAGWRHWVRTTA
jgi:hypothetical protein